MIARDNNISLALGVPGIILQFVGNLLRLNKTYDAIGVLVLVIGTLLLIGGLAYYAKAKGRSPAWGLMGFLSLLGLLVLALLKDQTIDVKPS